VLKPLHTFNISINEKLYIKDPISTNIGRKIIFYGIEMIDEIGFETLTFKKLATRIDSTEATIYRYFENKHNLLVYLVSWYWSWLENQITEVISKEIITKQKIRKVIEIIVEDRFKTSEFNFINQEALHRIVVSESPKSYYTKGVDSENKDGFFRNYKSLCKQIANLILEINPNYPYAYALATTILEAANQQVFFSEHLPSLTDLKLRDGALKPLTEYLEHLVLKLTKQESEAT